MSGSGKAVSPETLKETAMAYWQANRRIPNSQWPHYVKGGLYEWAVETQARLLGGNTNGVPSKEALLEHVAPTPSPLVLLSAPAPSVVEPTQLSTRAKNRSKRSVEAVQARASKEQTLAFSPHDLVMFSLPHKRLDATTYERLNGRLRITLTTRNGYTIPFGQDRLFPIWLATAFQAAGQPVDNVVRFRSATDILQAFRQSPDGDSRKSLRERILRWHHTTIDVDGSTDDSVHHLSYGLIEEAHLWFQQKGGVNQFSLWQNSIKLHSRFADGLRKNAIPVDFETIVSLRDIPGALDLYIWQAHRSWEIAQGGSNRPTVIPIASLLAQLGTQSPPRKAKQLIQQWQRIVKEVWKGCPNYFDPKRNAFFLYAGRAVFGRSTTKLPGVLPVPPVPLRLAGSFSADEVTVLKAEPQALAPLKTSVALDTHLR